MKKIEIPCQTCNVGNMVFTPMIVLRQLVLNLPYWKMEMDINRVSAVLEIEEQLDKISELPCKIELTLDTWSHLKNAMQHIGVQPINDASLNRLYMNIYRNVLAAV